MKVAMVNETVALLFTKQKDSSPFFFPSELCGIFTAALD